MESIIKIIFVAGAILLWFLGKMKKSRKSKEKTSTDQEVIESPEDLLPEWDEGFDEEESTEEKAQPAMNSSEETTEITSPSETEPAREEESEEEKPKEKKSAPITIAGVPFDSKNIRYGIIFSEILKPRGKNLKK